MSNTFQIPFIMTYREIKITTAGGKEYSITELVQQLSVYEDIFSNTITGEIVIADSNDSKGTLKLKGNEKITIDFIEGNSDGTILVKDFYVYAAGNNIRPQATGEVYTISFISVEAILNEHTKVYSAIDGSNSDSVQVLMSYFNTQKPFEAESTSGNHKFIMPSWSPFEGINWYAGRSVSQESGGSYFLFYENLKGFNFKSVEKLISEPPTFEYRYEPAGHTPIIKDISNIREFFVVDMGDSLKGSSENYTTLWNNDLVRKKITKQRFEYESDNKGTLGSTLLGTSTQNGFNLDLKERRDLFGSEVISRNETRNVHTQTQGYTYDSIQPKLSAIRQFSNLKIKFLAFGNKNLKVGDVVDIKISKAIEFTEETKKYAEDKTLTGKYLITAIHFIYKLNDFQMSVEAVKDSRND